MGSGWVINEFVLYAPVFFPLRIDAYRSEGMCYIAAADFATMIDNPVAKVRRLAKKLVAQGELNREDFRKIPYVTADGDIVEATGYSLNAVEMVADRLKCDCTQYLLWAHARLDNSKLAEYDALISRLKREDQARASKFRYCLFDYLWYVGEATPKKTFSSTYGLTQLIIVSSVLLSPIYIIFLSNYLSSWIFLGGLSAIIYAVCHFRLTDERKEAIIIHYSAKNVNAEVDIIFIVLGLLFYMVVVILLIFVYK